MRSFCHENIYFNLQSHSTQLQSHLTSTSNKKKKLNSMKGLQELLDKLGNNTSKLKGQDTYANTSISSEV